MQPTLEQWLNRKPKGKAPRLPLKRCRVKRVSSKRAKQVKSYTALRKKILKERPYCEIWLKLAGLKKSDVDNEGCIFTGSSYMFVPLSVEIHHPAGRIGKKLIDEKNCMAVSREMHVWAHAHPSEARTLGLLQ